MNWTSSRCAPLLAALTLGLGVLGGPALLVARAAGPTITLYNGQHEETTDALVQAFEQQSGITVQVRNDDEDVLAYQILDEGNSSPADAIYTENSPALMYLGEQGALAPVDPATLSAVPAAYNSPQGQWVGVTRRVSTMIYNTSLLQPNQLPRSVMDLADPRWHGKLAIAAGETDFQPVVTSILKTYGQAATLTWLGAIKANAGDNVFPDNESLTAAVDQGQAAIGIINHYYWYRARADANGQPMHSAIAYFQPGDAGFVLDISGAAVLRSSPNQDAAQQFLAFLVSHPGQQVIATSNSFEYPIVSGVAAPQLLIAFNQLSPVPLSIADLGDGQAAISLLQQAQLL